MLLNCEDKMNSNHSNWTGRTHRTMQSAFGPHTSQTIYEEVTTHQHDKIVMWACVVALVLFVGIMFWS